MGARIKCKVWRPHLLIEVMERLKVATFTPIAAGCLKVATVMIEEKA